MTEMPETLAIALNPNRWRILCALNGSSMTAKTIADAVDLSPQAVNKHMKRLKDAGFVHVYQVPPEDGGPRVKRYSLREQRWSIRITERETKIVGVVDGEEVVWPGNHHAVQDRDEAEEAGGTEDGP